MFNKKNYKISIEGMKCANCTNHTKEALKKLDFIKDVKVELTHAKITVKNELTTEEENSIRTAIKDAGYSVTSINML